MRRYLYGLCLLLLCLLCSGCGAKNEEIETEQSDASEASGEPAVLVYGYVGGDPFRGLDSEIEKQIAKFNRSQDEYFIEIKQYGEDDYTDGLNSLNAELAAGKGPDIIQINDDSQFRVYAKKGMLADLYPFLDEDTELSREDFFESVLAQFETDDTLCGIVPLFSIWSTIGNPNFISSDRVTLAELQQMWEEGGDVIPYQPMYRETALSFLYEGDMSAFVDWKNKTCDFINEEFISFLEFSNQFPSRSDSSGQVGTYELYQNMQANKVCMVQDMSISCFDDYTQYKSFFGQDALLIGSPSIDGCGPSISHMFPYLTINNNSEKKAGAWQFIRAFLQTEFLLAQDNERKGFPILKEAFELRAQEAMEGTWETDEEGNRVEVTPDQRSSIDPAGNEMSWPVYAATEEEVSYIRNTIENLEVPLGYGEIPSIIYEEVIDYWNGVKSAEEVAEVIQNRATNYLNEIS